MAIRGSRNLPYFTCIEKSWSRNWSRTKEKFVNCDDQVRKSNSDWHFDYFSKIIRMISVIPFCCHPHILLWFLNYCLKFMWIPIMHVSKHWSLLREKYWIIVACCNARVDKQKEDLRKKCNYTLRKEIGKKKRTDAASSGVCSAQRTESRGIAQVFRSNKVMRIAVEKVKILWR